MRWVASHGTGFLRIFSGDWRRANRLVRSVLTSPTTPLDEMLVLLDALAKGQAAKRTIEEEDVFARTAFGTEWRATRSTAAGQLSSVVEWMRSLRGLGPEPRIIAARRPDRSEVGTRGVRTSDLLADASTPLEAFWSALGASQAIAFGDALSANRADITSLMAVVARMHSADVTTSAAFADTAADLNLRRQRVADLIEMQAKTAVINESPELGTSAFGSAWQGTRSDWHALRGAADWILENGDIRLLSSQITDHAAPASAAERLAADAARLTQDLAAIGQQLRLDVTIALGESSFAQVSLSDLRAHLDRSRASGEQLSQWTAYRDRAERASALGCDDLVRRLAVGRLTTDAAVAAFEMAYYERIYADQIRVDPHLGTFDGTLHGRLAREFADMDRQRISSASFEVVRAHHDGVPARDGGAVGPLGVLRAEIARKRGHMPFRRLMEKAAPAVQALNPSS